MNLVLAFSCHPGPSLFSTRPKSPDQRADKGEKERKKKGRVGG